MNNEVSIALEIFKNFSFSDEEVHCINEKFKRMELSKGMVILQPDFFVDYQYYIYSGCLRSYFIQKSGKETTIQFAINDWWISDYTSYFSKEKSIMSIECIQNAVVYRISKSDMEKLYKEIPEIESFFRIKLEKAFASFQKRILEYLTLSARERYLKFVEQYPEIISCIRNYHIASYLGITTESLSRIRKLSSKKNN